MQNGNRVAEEQNATKDRIEGRDVLKLLSDKSKLVVVKGKQTIRIDLKDAPSDDDCVAAMTGPTGNLRAPTVVVGKTVLIGFHADIYEEFL